MLKLARSLLLAAPIAVASPIVASSPTIAAEVINATQPYSLDNPTATAPFDSVTGVSSLDPADGNITPFMDQVTSVSQLTDIRPTDWAFQALQSLVERYGCIVGYPDRTYRGNRALTRYEFAAGLNACIDRVNELIAASTADLVKKEDLTALQRLQEEFAAELVALRGRVDVLETRATTLERQQFSATTKLNGLMWFNLTGAFISGDDRVLTERGVAGSAFAPPRRNPATQVPSRVLRDEPEVTLSYYSFLTFNTSFTGKDSLITQFAVGNGDSPANQLVSAGFYNSWGTPFTDQSGTPIQSSVVIRELAYAFPIGSSVRLAVGPRLNWYRYFDGNRFTNFLTGSGSFNSSGSTLMNAIDRGSGAALIWNISPQLRFAAAYLAENTEFLNPAVFNTSNNPAIGLFNPTNTITGELTFSPSPSFNLRLLYTRSNLRAYNGFIGGSVGEPLPYGFADDGFGGQVNDATADAFVANFDWLITRGFGIFGRYSYGSTNIDPVNPLRSGGEVDVQSFQIGLGFPDLGKKGALGVISFLVPHDFINGQEFLLSGSGDGGTQYELEASYYYPLSNNVALVPAFYAIWNANNFDSNPTVFVGNLRAQFSF
ncbi:carbohydrate porin [Leptolyngbya sp. FACHB-36]|uniref:iron uptake porin n=1 Tax=Leptolyngbya sp. FACHB-36 TaxID=2692808 RepID=UPI001681BAE2|nr:iron uptake porin [Leptolyngbya sp. FACHB-36]MBD2019632.1 carbohydrate porin [Leptolyngbya sp. FACHB-36]